MNEIKEPAGQLLPSLDLDQKVVRSTRIGEDKATRPTQCPKEAFGESSSEKRALLSRHGKTQRNLKCS